MKMTQARLAKIVSQEVSTVLKEAKKKKNDKKSKASDEPRKDAWAGGDNLNDPQDWDKTLGLIEKYESRILLRQIIRDSLPSMLETTPDPLDAFAEPSPIKRKPLDIKPIEPPKSEPTLPKDMKAKIVTKLQYGWERAVKAGDIQPKGKFGFIATVMAHPLTTGSDKGKFRIWLTKVTYDKSGSAVDRNTVEDIIRHSGQRRRDLGVSDEALDGDFKVKLWH